MIRPRYIACMGVLVIGISLATPGHASAQLGCVGLVFAAAKTLPACAGVLEGMADPQLCVSALAGAAGLAAACGNEVGAVLAWLVRLFEPADYSQVNCLWTPFDSPWHGWCEACGNLLDREGVAWTLDNLAETCRRRFTPAWGQSVWSSGGIDGDTHHPENQNADPGTGSGGWGTFWGGYGTSPGTVTVCTTWVFNGQTTIRCF